MDSTVELCNKVGKDDCKINCFEDLEYNNNNKQPGLARGYCRRKHESKVRITGKGCLTHLILAPKTVHKTLSPLNYHRTQKNKKHRVEV